MTLWKCPERHEDGDYVNRPDLKAVLNLMRLTFPIPSRKFKPKRCQLKIKAGEKVGIIGRWLGKTTIEKLILGLNRKKERFGLMVLI